MRPRFSRSVVTSGSRYTLKVVTSGIIDRNPSISHGALPSAFARSVICAMSNSDKSRPIDPNRPTRLSLTCSAEMLMDMTAQQVVTREAVLAGFRTLARIRSTRSVEFMAVIIGALHAACSREFPANSILIESSGSSERIPLPTRARQFMVTSPYQRFDARTANQQIFVGCASAPVVRWSQEAI